MFYIVIAFFICFIDQASKFCAEKFILTPSGLPVIDGVLHLTLVYNTGIAFGLFKQYPFVFTVVTAAAIVIIVYFLLQKKYILNEWESFSLGFILGGSAGNLIDRLRFGHIVDFIDFRVWPVFNLADSFILIGAVILVFSIFFKRRNP